MKFLYLELLLISVFLISSPLCFSEGLSNSEVNFFDKEKFAFSLKGGKLFNLHTAKFIKFKNSKGCDYFEKGFGIGSLFSLGFEKAIDSNFQIGCDFTYTVRSADVFYNYGFESLNYTTGDVFDVEIRSNIAANLSFIEFQPKINYVLFQKFINAPLRIFGGLRILAPINHSFMQYERIEKPSFVYFEINRDNISKIKKIAEGEIGNISKIGFGINLGIENFLKLSERLHWIQQISCDLAFSNVTSDVNWKPHSINLAMGLRYNFPEKQIVKIDTVKTEIIVPIEIDTIPRLKLEYLGFEGKIETGSEFLATKPIVNAVFFANNSAELPDYISFEAVSQEEKYYQNPVILHSKILPQIVEILNKNPKSTLELVGATAGDKFETGGISLAKERANSVKNAFIKLGLSENRITVTSNLLPEFPSNDIFEDGVKENQRVDIIVKNAQLQEYVDFLKYSEIIGNKKYFVSVENSKKQINFNSLSIIDDDIQQENRLLVKDFKDILVLPIAKRIKSIPQPNFMTNSATLSIDSFSSTVNDTIYFDKLDVINVEKNYFNFEAIIRFNYNSSLLTDENKELLRQIALVIPENSTILILGSADTLGTQKRNEELSEQRAKNTMDFIDFVAKNRFKFEIGRNFNKFDESTPQGRMLNRSILVRVKK